MTSASAPCYHQAMRRALAALLMLAFSFPLIAPALASASEDSSLPACCRRDGKHHCALTEVSSVPARYTVVAEKCPFPLLVHPALMLPHHFAPRHPANTAVAASSPSAILRQAEAGYRISRDRARSKRGPPAIELL